MILLVSLRQSNRNLITGISTWTRPKVAIHWAPGRSAMELAKAWCRTTPPSAPQEMIATLDRENRFVGLILDEGAPEKRTSLKESGNGRNHDLWVKGHTSMETVTLCVEAKADESFGSYSVEKYLEKANEKISQGMDTKVPERVRSLLQTVEGGIEEWGHVRYQLLAALCGLVEQIKIDSSTVGILLVHEFISKTVDLKKVARNKNDYEALVKVLFKSKTSRNHGDICGPFWVGGVECYLGKITTTI